MTILRIVGENTLLRDYGQGTTDDLTKAHQYTDDEVVMTVALREDVVPLNADEFRYSMLTSFEEDELPVLRSGFVWVRKGGAWLAADPQGLTLATRAALQEIKQAKRKA